LVFKVDGKYATVTLPLLTASDDRCGD